MHGDRDSGASQMGKSGTSRRALVSEARSKELRKEYEERKLRPEARRNLDRRDAAARLRSQRIQEQR